MIKPKIICILIYIIITNSIYSQNFTDGFISYISIGRNIGFSFNVPENWVAMENRVDNNIYSLFMKNNIYKDPIIVMSIHDLNDATDEALRECIDIILKFKSNITQVEQNYLIEGNICTYDVNLISVYFSRHVFFRYRHYGFHIELTSPVYQRVSNETIIILNELVNSINFAEVIDKRGNRM